MQLKEIHFWIESSKHKPWQIYLLAGSLLTATGLYFKIQIIISVLRTIEGILLGWEWIVILGIQGVLVGFVAESLYEQGDGYAKAGSHLFGSKDRTLIFRIGVMTVVSGVITKVVPTFLENATEFLILQTAGAVLVLGILLVHVGSSDWKIRTEWPAIAAGVIFALAPSIA